MVFAREDNREIMRKGAIFDLDGTLLDSMGVWRRIDEIFLGKRNITVTDEYMKAITSKTFDEAAEYTIARYQLQESKEAIVKEWADMAVDTYANEITLKPYVREYLTSLRERGIKITAATSSDSSLFLPCLEHNGILNWFDSITMTSEAARGKGYPDVYELAASRIGLLAQDCVVFEDILKGIRGAKLGGFYAVGVEDIHSSYEWEEMRNEADCFISSFDELL